jgi:hypothetical protein
LGKIFLEIKDGGESTNDAEGGLQPALARAPERAVTERRA